MNGRQPRVFVSYAHDSDRHKRAVLTFCTLLRDECGIDVHIDQWYEDSRRDWSLWFVEQLDSADFVVVVASPEYKRRAEGRAAADVGRGSQFEAALLRDKLTQDLAKWTRKIIPVVLPGQSIADIPVFLQPYAATHYRISDLTADALAELASVLHGQPGRKRVAPTLVPTRFPVLSLGIVAALVIAILVAVWLIWPTDEGSADRWREVLRWNGYPLRPASFSCTDGVVDKVDLDTGKPGRGWQPQLCKADGGYAELILDETDVHTYAGNVRAILPMPDGTELTAEACDLTIERDTGKLRNSIRLDDLRAGSKACVRTDEDKIAGVTFTRIPSAEDPRLLLDFVVWEANA